MARSESKPAALVDFSDSDQARAWFGLQPREVCIALSVRAALRVVPLIEANRRILDFAPRVALPAMRACFVAWAIAKYPSQRSSLRSGAANAAAAYDAAAYATAVYDAAAYAAANAAAAYDAAAYATTAYVAAASAAYEADAAVRADAVAVEQGRAVAEIAAAPLWPGEIPERIAEAWDRLRTWMLEDAANSWEPWVQWYERVRDGRPSFGEAFDLAVASLTDEEWNEEPVPAAVNRRITALLAEHTGGVKPPVVGAMAAREGEPQTGPDPAASEARQSPKPNRRTSSPPAKRTARTTIGKALLERSEQVQLALVAVISLVDEKLQQLRANRPNHPETIDEWTNEISEFEKLRGIVEGLQADVRDYLAGAKDLKRDRPLR